MNSRNDDAARSPLATRLEKLKDSLGCQAAGLEKDQHVAADGIRFHRKRSQTKQMGRVTTSSSDRGFLIGVSMGDGHRRQIHQGRRSTQHDFGAGSIYIRNFADEYSADLKGGFDFVLLEMAPNFISRAMGDALPSGAMALSCLAGQRDPVLFHLVQAIVPALEQPQQACALFVEQLALAVGTHLVGRYGGQAISTPVKRRVLSRAQETRAKEMLLARPGGSQSIAEIAQECGLSPSYFIYAFRETTGQTPHRWLLTQRVKLACRLLQTSDVALAQIAIDCGFADQSHFSKVFTQLMSVSPGVWRRSSRS